MRLLVMLVAVVLGLLGLFMVLFGQLAGLIPLVLGALLVMALNNQKRRQKEAEEAEWRRQMLEKHN